MNTKCLWCLKEKPEVTFDKKAHTIPKSLGGQNYNRNICDSCNEFFGNRNSNNGNYSIEEALKETFTISRWRFLNQKDTKKQIGRFKSKFFDLKQRNGKYRIDLKPHFKFSAEFQTEICRAFKRGLYKLFLEELNRQKNIGFESKYDIIRDFARNNIGDLPVLYFQRMFGALIMMEREAETPVLFFDRMKYLYTNDKFTEIEFLGHVFGFPVSKFNTEDFNRYISESMKLKQKFFKSAVLIKRMLDVDLTLNILG